MSADALIPTDKQIERERQRRKQQDTAPPLRNPLSAEMVALLAECQKHRAPLVAAMRGGDFAGPLTGWPKALFIPPVERLWQAAFALDTGAVPPFPGKPVTALECVAALDTLIAWCREKQGPIPASLELLSEKPPAEGRKKRGGKRPLEESNPALAELYEKIIPAYECIKSYHDTAAALNRQCDIKALARQAGNIPINSGTIKRAVEWWRTRKNRPLKNQQTNIADSD